MNWGSGRIGVGEFPVLRIPAIPVLVCLVLLQGSCSDQRTASTASTASTVEPVRTVDETYAPDLGSPAFLEGAGPVVCIDEAHNNFHTAEGTYRPFAEVLSRDGYRVQRATQPIDLELLVSCDILVIADAQPPARSGAPPTFSKDHVGALNAWVQRGASLFIITDHMPDPGTIRELAASFGLEVNDGYVMEGGLEAGRRPILFQSANETVVPDPLTLEMGADEGIHQVATFTGSAFRLLPDFASLAAVDPFRPLLVFGPEVESWMPEVYYDFNDQTPRIDVEGWFQGGVMNWGEGRLAFFSEAAMFTAQVFEEGRVKVGLNAPESVDNLRLLRRVMRWLAGDWPV